MRVKKFLSFLLGTIMVGLFLVQMWELFVQFHSGMKAIAISFDERDEIEFPSFAFCDSKAFTKRIGMTPNATLYNASTFNLETENSLVYYVNHSVESFPTISNGYCTLYTFHEKYDDSQYIGMQSLAVVLS